MGLLRFTLLVVCAAVFSLGIVSGAGAGNFDEERMGCVGEDPGICPTGTTGEPYSIPVLLLGDEDTVCATFYVDGSLPPGLSITRFPNETNAGRISGTPTQAGTYEFYLRVTYDEREGAPEWCGKAASDDRFVIKINQGLAKLTLGPESTSAGTTGVPYSLQMTATVPDAKTWSINSGQLPPGLSLDANTGLISGTPTTAGSYTFEVYAKMVADSRSDTKVLGITIRDPLAISADEPFSFAGIAVGEVTVPFQAMLAVTGGDGTYVWSLGAGRLPPGLAFAQGALAGTPRRAGIFRFTARVTDGEGRVADYPARIVVAQKLAVATRVIKPGRVDRFFQRKLAARGGVRPTDWRVVRGPLPRGVFLDRTAGVLYGYPQRPGRFRVVFEATDSLGVKARKTLRIVVFPAPAKRR